jgi:hypothetical protein
LDLFGYRVEFLLVRCSMRSSMALTTATSLNTGRGISDLCF